MIWSYGGTSKDDDGEFRFPGTLAAVAIHNDLVFANAQSGFGYCFDLDTGKLNWKFDYLASVFGSPIVMNDNLIQVTDDGVYAGKANSSDPEFVKHSEFSYYYSTPAILDNSFYVAGQNKLYKFQFDADREKSK